MANRTRERQLALPGMPKPQEAHLTPSGKKRPHRRGSDVFTEAVKLLRAKRQRIYGEPLHVETLDGKRVQMNTTSTDLDGRPVTYQMPRVSVPFVSDSARRLARILEQGTKNKRNKRALDYTHQSVRRNTGCIHIRGLAYDATRPQVGEPANLGNLGKMAGIARSILSKKR